MKVMQPEKENEDAAAPGFWCSVTARQSLSPAVSLGIRANQLRFMSILSAIIIKQDCRMQVTIFNQRHVTDVVDVMVAQSSLSS